MAKISSKSAFAKESITRFEGIKNSDDFLGSGASEIRNFRIKQDGSLEKRCGWVLYQSCPDRIRAYWEGNIANTQRCFAVCGAAVYRIDASGEFVFLRSLSSATDRATFFFHHDTLFLMADGTIFAFRTDQGTFSKAFGYVPLVGRDWHPATGGSILEPLNLLNPFYRITYHNPGGYTEYKLPYPGSMLIVEVNGTPCIHYNYTAGSNVFSLQESDTGTVSVTCLSNAPTMTEEILSSTLFAHLEDEKHSSLVLSGGSPGYRVYVSEPVNDTELAAARKELIEADPLYFPQRNLLIMGNSETPVTALCKQKERVLAFNGTAAWSIGFEGSMSYIPEATMVDNGIGCPQQDALTPAGNSLIVANSSGIWKISTPVNHPNDWTVEELSTVIFDRVRAVLRKNVITAWLPQYNEFWMRDVEDSSGTVWIYSTENKEWYCFDNIPAHRFFQSSVGYGFCSDSKICLFDERLECDNLTTPIRAVYQSGYLTLSQPTEQKGILHASLCLGPQGHGLSLTMETEHRQKIISFPYEESQNAWLYRHARVNLSPFRYLRFTLVSSGIDRCRCHRIDFLASK